MAKKIRIALTPFKNIDLKIPDKKDLVNIPLSLNYISSFINNNIFLVLTLLLFFLPSIKIGGENALFLILYSSILISFFIKLIRKLYIEQESFPSIPYDLSSLLFTTGIAFSFFYNTVASMNNKNIWGGSQFNEISGISIISYFSLYYLFYIQASGKNRLNKLILLLSLSPIVSFILALLFNVQIAQSSYTILILLQPMYLYQFLKGNKYKLITLFNILLSLYLLSLSSNVLTTFSLIIAYLFIVIFTIINKRNELFKMIRTLDKTDKPFNMLNYVKKNGEVIFLVFSIFFVLLGSRWIYMNMTQNDLNEILDGYRSLGNLEGISIILGQGYLSSTSAKIVQFILAYGLLPLGLFSIIVIKFIKDVFKTFKTSKDQKANILMKLMILGILPNSILIILSKDNTDLIFIFLTLMVSILLAVRSMIMKDKTVITSEKISKTVVKKANWEYFLSILKILMIIIAFIMLMYLLSFLNYINIFINK